METAVTSQYREAIEHLPPGGMLVVQNVTWEEYEHLLDELADRPGVRVTYDQGRLQAVSPLRAHEHYARIMEVIGDLAAEALDLPFESMGATALRQVKGLRGVEPDDCFYITNEQRIAGKVTLDLESDPPPDIVVEVDLSTDSGAKLPIYAAMGVPEIWFYNGRRAKILELGPSGYVERQESKTLPLTTVAVLEHFLDLSKTHGKRAIRRLFSASLKP
jgi:Uma2 family endonuclease